MTLKDQFSLLLVLGYAAGVLMLLAGVIMKLVNRRKKKEKLKNISLALISIGIAATVLTLMYHIRLNV